MKKEVKSFVIIVTLVLAFRSVFFEPFKIPSGSMIPTLLIGDFILVNKFSYGLKVPFSDWFSDPIYLTEPSRPERGDIVVFKFPGDENVNYIKRVIGLPGDTVEVINKTVYVNGKPIQDERIDGAKIMEDMDDKFLNANFVFRKSSTGDKEHVSQIDLDNSYLLNYPSTVIPDNNYFVMGDNRDFSSDSRAWGTVDFRLIKGKAKLIWFSLSLPLPFQEYEEYFKFRPWRIGTVLE